MSSNRTTFLVDGFNLYHSVVEASADLSGASTKWLNIRALCESYLPSFGRGNVPEAFYYFSALARHRLRQDPGVLTRHRALIDCLKSTGVIVELSRFKAKQIWCTGCQTRAVRHEEKETDVALAVKLIDLFLTDSCDTAVLVTGDTDIAPAVRYVIQRHPKKRVCFLFPYRRKNKELAKLGSSCKISKEQYRKHQFPEVVVLADGTQRVRPPTW
jgi:uncharacterized LabA/DUF88 family protein